MSLAEFFGRWKQLFVTGAVYKLIAFVVLTPLFVALFRLMVATSGKTVLADQDILFFFVAPTGWLCLIAIGVSWIGISAAELAALLVVLMPDKSQRVRARDAIRIATLSAPRFGQVIARIVSITLLAVSPFLATAAITYAMLLTDFDINFYLKETPPAFKAAVVIGGVILVLVSGIVLHLATNWLFALPIVLFENITPATSLRVSRQRATGHRVKLALWVFSWTLCILLLSGLSTQLVLKVGELFVSGMSSSLPLLTFAIGLSLVAWSVLHLFINLLGMTSFATLLMALYRTYGGGQTVDVSAISIKHAEGPATHFRWTWRRLAGLAVGGIAVVAGTGYLAFSSVTREDNVKVIAHRGASESAPENTMAAVRQAIDDGADWIEIDVQETADGDVVVFHDSDFMKLSGAELKIWNATRSDLNDLDIGSWFGPAFANERVPKLAAVLEECRGRAGVVIELKYYGHDQKLEQRVVDIVEASGMMDNVMLMSLKLNAVEKIKTLRPDWKVGLLMSVAAGNWKKLDADFLAVNGAFLSQSMITSAHSSGREVYVWTINDAVTMSTLIGRGADGIITDKPALGRTVLTLRAEMSVGERLLLELAETFGVAADIADQ